MNIHSTYRLQLRKEFGFSAAETVIPYLFKLGISHLYLSPSTQSVAGSVHGYDVVDPTKVNEELGGDDAFHSLVRTAQVHGIGLIVDIVPNHMAIAGRTNKWWWDVLRRGHSSEYAHFFDIDWTPPESKLRNKVLMPVLGDHYGRVLENNELCLKRTHDEVVVAYYDQEFPLDPTTIDDGLNLDAVNSDVEQLDTLIDAQNYRLAFWRVAKEELDYRRFFDIDALVALRVEDESVFNETHQLVSQWLRDGVVDGVRIDHIDGLKDPVGYLKRVRSFSDNAWIGVEKILAVGERLPATWPVQGTTGYDTSRLVDGLFVQPETEKQFTAFYDEICGSPQDWESIVVTAKKHVVTEVLGSDVARLTDILVRICQDERRFRDFIRDELRSALEAVLVCMPVYRTYVDAASLRITSADRNVIADALEGAMRLEPEIDPELFHLIGSILQLEMTGVHQAELAMRFQQLSGPVCAKSVEDTAFYRYARFVMTNEVGSDPGLWSTRPDDFHEQATEGQRLWPFGMNSASTHDSKRSADVRMRLAVLSEFPDEWEHAVREWMEINSTLRQPELDVVTEYLYYQTVVGAYPIGEDRLTEYMMKAVREAKLNTSWTSRDLDYELAVERFVRSTINDSRFTASVEQFLGLIQDRARTNSLSATAIRFTMPGIPDTYQGDELWNYTLVDPDNRSLVDYNGLSTLADELDSNLDGLLDSPEFGAAKLLVSGCCARLRRRRFECFGSDAQYEAVVATGDHAVNVFAFSRNAQIVTVVPRVARGVSKWNDTRCLVPSGTWRNIFTNETFEGDVLRLDELFQRFPVAVLEKIDR